jgi:hypothetical protein
MLERILSLPTGPGPDRGQGRQAISPLLQSTHPSGLIYGVDFFTPCEGLLVRSIFHNFSLTSPHKFINFDEGPFLKGMGFFLFTAEKKNNLLKERDRR